MTELVQNLTVVDWLIIVADMSTVAFQVKGQEIQNVSHELIKPPKQMFGLNKRFRGKYFKLLKIYYQKLLTSTYLEKYF